MRRISGLGELRPGLEIGLGVQPDADPVGGPAAAALALVGRGLRDRLDRQPLHLGPVAVPGDARGAGVDDVADAGDGQRGLGHVGGQHDAAGVAARGPGEDPVLLGGGQPGVQRQHLEPVTPGQQVGGVADLALAGQEDQDVAGTRGGQLVDRVADGLALVGVLAALAALERPVAHLDRVGPAGHLDDRRAAEGRGEALRVDGGRGDDDLEVGTLGQELAEVAEDEIDVQAALVRLVDDQRVIAAERAVAGQLGQHDAIGHQLDQRVIGGHVGEPHLVADRLAERAAQFLGDPLRHGAGRQPARLGVADLPGDAPAQLEADLRDLGRLARAGLPRDDHDLVVLDRAGDLVLVLADRQLGRIGDGRHGRPARGAGRGVPLGTGAGPAVTRAPGPGAPGSRLGRGGLRLRRGELSRRRHHGSRLHCGGRIRPIGPYHITVFCPGAFRPRPAPCGDPGFTWPAGGETGASARWGGEGRGGRGGWMAG